MEPGTGRGGAGLKLLTGLWRLHPAWLAALCVAMFVAGAAVSDQPLPGVTIYSLTWIALLLWVHSIYAFSRTALVERGRSRRNLDWVFLVAAIGAPLFWIRLGLVMAGYPEWLTAPHPSQVIGLPVIIAFFGAFGLTAFELAYAEREERPTPFGGAVFGRFLLLVYFPIGAWFIRPRLRRIEDRA